MARARGVVVALVSFAIACGARGGAPPSAPVASAPAYDVIVRGGTIVDGSGAPGRVADLAIAGDRVAAIGDLHAARGRSEIDARGMVVAPGFVNMMSQGYESLLVDGRGASDVTQGVTLEVFGEGWSQGPLNDRLKKELVTDNDLRYAVTWTTLGEYLDALVAHGVSPNVASFVGAATVREVVVGESARAASDAELAEMQRLVRQAMEEGALGVGAGLVYPPGVFADTKELVALAKAAAPYGGMFVAHMRSEGNKLLEAIDEMIAIGKESGAPIEIFHFKEAGRGNWSKIDAAIDRVKKAREAGLRVTADVYPYTASATGLDVAMPPWSEEGGYADWASRLRDPAARARIAREMTSTSTSWENNFTAVESPDQILLVGFHNPYLRPLTGESLGAIARARHEAPEETAMDLVEEDGSRVETIYFLMSEANVKRTVALPWTSFCSDAEAIAPEGIFLKKSRHPRTYGAFARVFAKYVRDEHALTIEEAVRKMTSLPIANLGIKGRGTLRPGYFADVVVFDPARIQDRATYAQPQQYATGVADVLVNGQLVVKGGALTGAHAGRVARGPGWKPRSK